MVLAFPSVQWVLVFVPLVPFAPEILFMTELDRVTFMQFLKFPKRYAPVPVAPPLCTAHTVSGYSFHFKLEPCCRRSCGTLVKVVALSHDMNTEDKWVGLGNQLPPSQASLVDANKSVWRQPESTSTTET